MVEALRVVMILLVLLAASLAGCIGGDDDVEGPAPVGDDDGGSGPTPPDGADKELPLKLAATTNIEKALQAIQVVPPGDLEYSRPNMTSRDWLLLSLPLTPEGTVHGFAWQVPEGSIIGADQGVNVVLDVAVALTPMGVPAGLPAGTDWALLAFHRQTDEGQNTFANAGDFMYGVTKMRSIDGGSPQQVEPYSGPFSLRIGYDGLAPGDTVWFVLAARGPAGSEFAVGLRMFGQEAIGFPKNYSPTTDWEDFRGAVGDRAPYVPERTLESEGLHIAYFKERHVILESSFSEHSVDAQAEDILPTDLYPTLTTRDLTITSASDFAGWSHAAGLYTSGGEAGAFNLQGDLHGTSFDLADGFMNSQALPDVISGRDAGVGFIALGSGSGGSFVTWNLQKSGTIAREDLDFVHLSVGVPVSEFTGLDHLDMARVWGGVV